MPLGGVIAERPVWANAATRRVPPTVVVTDGALRPLEFRVIRPAATSTGLVASPPEYARTEPAAPVAVANVNAYAEGSAAVATFTKIACVIEVDALLHDVRTTSVHPAGGVIAEVESRRYATVASRTLPAATVVGRLIESVVDDAADAALDPEVNAGVAAGAAPVSTAARTTVTVSAATPDATAFLPFRRRTASFVPSPAS